jgi:hypothetical protein
MVVLLQRNRFQAKPYGATMFIDCHNLQLPLLCQLSKSAPNILWSVGSSLHNQFLQVGRGNPAVMAAKLSLRSLRAGPAEKASGAAKVTVHAVRS